jgi:hypothetical protein
LSLMYAGGGGSASWLLVGYLAANLTGLAMAIRYGDRSRPSRLDVVCASGAAAALVIWLTADALSEAITFNLLANAIATLPTIKNARQGYEPVLPWFMTSAAAFLSIVALQAADFTAAATPIYFAVVNTLLLTLSLQAYARGRRPVSRT